MPATTRQRGLTASTGLFVLAGTLMFASAAEARVIKAAMSAQDLIADAAGRTGATAAPTTGSARADAPAPPTDAPAKPSAAIDQPDPPSERAAAAAARAARALAEEGGQLPDATDLGGSDLVSMDEAAAASSARGAGQPVDGATRARSSNAMKCVAGC